jgi:hypothetical protein
MNRIIIIFLVLPLFTIANQDSLLNIDKLDVDSITELSEQEELKREKSSLLKQENIFAWRLRELDKNTPMDLVYNDKVQVFIDNYL